MPPFPSPIVPQPQFPYTTPIAQRPFALLPPLHGGFPSFSSSGHSAIPPPGFEKGPKTDLIIASSVELESPRLPIDEGFGGRDDRRPSVIELTLAPLTCPKSTIHIVVEDNGKIQKFPIHRDLLCFYSPYFRCVLAPKIIKARIKNKNQRREWRWEDRERVGEIMDISGSADSEEKTEVDVVIKLPDMVREASVNTEEKKEYSGIMRELKLDTEGVGEVGRTVFAAFVNWLYHGYSGFGLHVPLDPLDHQFFDGATLIQLWVFAGRIGVPECQNHCIEGIEWWRATTNIIQTSMLNWVYENTQDCFEEGECGLRALLIDQCAWKLDGLWLLSERDGKKNEEQFPRQALVDLVSRMRVVLNEHVVPPFAFSELRKGAYWIGFEEQRVREVLEGFGWKAA